MRFSRWGCEKCKHFIWGVPYTGENKKKKRGGIRKRRRRHLPNGTHAQWANTIFVY